MAYINMTNQQPPSPFHNSTYVSNMQKAAANKKAFIPRSRYGKTSGKMTKETVTALIKKHIDTEAELKFYGVYQIPVTVDNNGVILALTDPLMGMNDNQRIGDRLRLKHQNIGYMIRAGASTVSNAVRVIAFQWKVMDNLDSPTLDGLLASYGSAVSSICSPYHHDNLEANKFGILYDKTHVVGPAGTINDMLVQTVNLDLKYARRDVQFTAAQSHGMNKLYVAFFSDETLGGAQAPTVEIEGQCTFTDM